jgi:hypothetical protein
MSDCIGELVDEVNRLAGHDILLQHRKIEQLAQEASRIKESDPEKSYNLLAVATSKSLQLPNTFDRFKRSLLEGCCQLISQLKGGDFIFEVELAELLKQKNDYLSAGTHFEHAADAFAREDGVRLVSEDRPRNGDWGWSFGYLRAAMSCFELGGDSAAASRCYLRSMHIKMEYANPWNKFKLLTSWMFWNWGESPWRVVGWGGIVILVFAVCFWNVGIKTNNETIYNEFIIL